MVVSGTPQKVRTESDFLCHPNPVNNELHISFLLESTSDIHLQLFTLSGQAVETLYQGRQVPGSHEILFNTEKLADGAYVLILRNGGNSKSTFVLVQH
jgi:hypothetical protein